MYIYMNVYFATVILFLKYLLLIDIFYIKRMYKLSEWKKPTIGLCEASSNLRYFLPKNYKDANILITDYCSWREADH